MPPALITLRNAPNACNDCVFPRHCANPLMFFGQWHLPALLRYSDHIRFQLYDGLALLLQGRYGLFSRRMIFVAFEDFCVSSYYMARVVVSVLSCVDSLKSTSELCGLVPSSFFPPASRPRASRTNLACFLHCKKNIRLPCNCAAQKAQCSIGVATLKAICHWSHKLPKRYMVTIVSKIVPPKVVKHANMNRRLRKWWESGYTR